jgi:hypothetical protein
MLCRRHSRQEVLSPWHRDLEHMSKLRWRRIWPGWGRCWSSSNAACYGRWRLRTHQSLMPSPVLLHCSRSSSRARGRTGSCNRGSSSSSSRSNRKRRVLITLSRRLSPPSIPCLRRPRMHRLGLGLGRLLEKDIFGQFYALPSSSTLPRFGFLSFFLLHFCDLQ